MLLWLFEIWKVAKIIWCNVLLLFMLQLSSFSVKEEIMKTLEKAWPFLFFFFFVMPAKFALCHIKASSIQMLSIWIGLWEIWIWEFFSALLRMQLASLLPWMGTKTMSWCVFVIMIILICNILVHMLCEVWKQFTSFCLHKTIFLHNVSI